MARVNITIPDDVVRAARSAGITISTAATAGLLAELDRRSRVAAVSDYLAELEAETGTVTSEEATLARGWADRAFGPRPDTDAERRTA